MTQRGHDRLSSSPQRPSASPFVALCCAVVPGLGLLTLGYRGAGLLWAAACFGGGALYAPVGYALWVGQVLDTARRATAER